MTDFSDKAGEEFDEEFPKHGYIAKAMRHMQAHIRTKYPEHFEIAESLNTLAQNLYIESTQLLAGKWSHDPFCVAVQIMPRALSAYQGALIATERGMHIEALTLARSIYEVAFWIGYLHQNPTVAKDTMFAEALRQEIEVHRLSLDVVKDRPELLALVRQRMSELGTELKKYDNPTVSILDLAKRAGFGNRYAEYRMLCGKAAHVGLQSTVHYLNTQSDGSFNGHIIGPDEDAVVEVFVFACGAIIMAIEATRWVTKITSHDGAFQTLMGRYAEVMTPMDEITN